MNKKTWVQLEFFKIVINVDLLTEVGEEMFQQ